MARGEQDDAYDHARKALFAGAAHIVPGDVAVSGCALLELANAEEPPLRVLFGVGGWKRCARSTPAGWTAGSSGTPSRAPRTAPPRRTRRPARDRPKRFRRRARGRIAWQSSGSGPRAVWAHGLTQSGGSQEAAGMFDWSPVTASGRSLLRYGARGHGESAGTPGAEAYTCGTEEPAGNAEGALSDAF